MISVHDTGTAGARGELSRFRHEFYQAMSARADTLFELTDAVLCAQGPVISLAELSLVPEHRRGHGALYDAVNHGRIEVNRLRVTLAGQPLPRAADGRLVLAVDVSPWLRPDAATSAQRLFCHTYGRSHGQAQMIPAGPTPSSPRWRPAAPVGPRCSTSNASGQPRTPPRSPPPNCVRS
jgi:hypothetical protein